MLTKKQAETLKVVKEFIGINQRAPSIREVMKEMGLKSPSNAHNHILELREKGLLRYNKQEGLSVVGKCPYCGKL